VERDGQVRHHRLRREPFERGQEADGRQRRAPRREMESLLIREDAQRLHRLVIVVQRLAHAHQDDVEGGCTHFERVGEHAHLADDLAGGQIPHEPHPAGQTERARHRAADLRRNAERHSRCVRNKDGLDCAAVLEPQQELLRPVHRFLAMNEQRCRQAESRRQIGAQLSRQVCHRVDARHAVAIDPAKDLSGVEARVPQVGKGRFERGPLQLREIGAVRHVIMCILSCNPFSLNRLQTFKAVPTTPIVRDVLGNGLRILTERMTQVRSVSIGVWLTRGSRHETAERSGIAHFVEHMLFKGTATRTAADIAQAIDSIGGQLDAFTAKEYASYYIKVLDEHLPLAVDILADIVRNPAFAPDDIEREKKVFVEEIKMVEDTPDDLVHEIFTQGFWENHPPGRPILGPRETVESFTAESLRRYFQGVYTAKNLIVSAVGNLEHERVRELVNEKFGSLVEPPAPTQDEAPQVVPKILIRNKELEQSHVCLGVGSYPQNHEDRYSSYVL